MKHLKIYFAILFFSFLGGANAELMAQSNVCKYDKQLTTLRSSNGKYEFSVARGSRVSGPDRDEHLYIFKLVKVGESTIWETSYQVNCNGEYITIGKGSVLAYPMNMNTREACVLIGGDNGQGTGTFLKLEDSGELALYGGAWYGDGDKVWSSGTCGGVLRGCGAVGSR
jgi:hypothetical protein